MIKFSCHSLYVVLGITAGCAVEGDAPAPADAVPPSTIAKLGTTNAQIAGELSTFNANKLGGSAIQAYCVGFISDDINTELDDTPTSSATWGKAVRCYGKTRPSGGTPNSDTVFLIGSTTKTFVGALLADAALDNRRCYDDKVINRLDGSNVPFWDWSFLWYARDKKARMTLLDLATHYSGLSKFTDPSPSVSSWEDPYTTPDLLSAFMVDSFACDPASTGDYHTNTTHCDEGDPEALGPNVTFSYSNFGVQLLSHAIASPGKTWHAEVDEKFLTPLDMDDTTITPSSAQKSRMAVAATVDADTPHSAWYAGAGSGGYYTTIHDLVQWLKWNMGRVNGIRPRSAYSGPTCGDFTPPSGSAVPQLDPVVVEMQRARRVSTSTLDMIGLTWDLALDEPSVGSVEISKGGDTSINDSNYHSWIGFTVRPDGSRPAGVVIVGLGGESAIKHEGRTLLEKLK